MILLIPNIDISMGMCAEKIKGEEGTDALYDFLSCNPDELIKLIRRENAKSVNLVDLDSFDELNIINHNSQIDLTKNLEMVKFVCKNTDIPIQLETYIESIDDIQKLFDLGIYRLIIKNNLKTNVINQGIIDKYGSSKISIILDADDYMDLEILLETIFINYMTYKNLRLVIDCNHSEFFDLETMNEFFSNMIFTNPRLKTNNYKFTLKNFVKSSQDLFSINQLEKYNIDSVIIGTELNNNIFPCQKIWRKIESKLEEKLLPKM